MIKEADIDEVIRVLKAGGDPTRLRIALALSLKRCCVCELAAGLELPQPTVSRCLRVLRDAAVVTAVRRGQWVEYELNDGHPFVKNVVAAVEKALKEKSLYTEDKKRVLKTDREKLRGKK